MLSTSDVAAMTGHSVHQVRRWLKSGCPCSLVPGATVMPRVIRRSGRLYVDPVTLSTFLALAGISAV